MARLAAQTRPSRQGPRINEQIDVPTIRLIGADSEQIGIVSIEEGLKAAEEAGLDLVEISPSADPPVCKVLDYGKLKYKESKKRAEAKKKQKVIDIKEIKLRPGIEAHDYEVKLRKIIDFLREGNKVKVTMRFRGREMAHQDLGLNVLMRIRDDVEEVGKIEQFPRTEGRLMTMVLTTK
ncbi:MAG: translation initiation factor IF-3 [Alphaproteobacteria bacterium]|nr:translation initiation factor IF-3 [Alphaproteobacteria bacterium]